MSADKPPSPDRVDGYLHIPDDKEHGYDHE